MIDPRELEDIDVDALPPWLKTVVMCIVAAKVVALIITLLVVVWALPFPLTD